MVEEDVSVVDLLNSFSVRARKHYQTKVVEPVRDGRKTLEKHLHRLDPRVDKVRRQLSNRLATIDRTFSKETVITRTEKLWFAISLVNIFYFGFLIGHYPRYMHVVYTFELSFLLPIRFYTYRKKEMQYYLADLCYFVNLLALLYIWVWPQSTLLWISCYSFAFGTLCFAIMTWRNSLVLHSIDKTTSTFIHILPPAVFHCINHRIPVEYKLERFPAAVSAQKWQSGRAVLQTTLAYFVWQSLYHYFITIQRADKIEEGRVTSFEYMRRKYKDTRIGRFVNGLPGFLPVLAFTMIQFGYQILTMLPCPLWYRYELLSSIFLTTIFAVACYNGATFYIDVFGQRFHKQVYELQKELDELVEQEASIADDSATSSSSSGPDSSTSSRNKL